MNVIYLSSVCSQTRFEDLVKKGVITSQFQNQKFHHLLLYGLNKAIHGAINVISYYPADRKKKKKRANAEYSGKAFFPVNCSDIMFLTIRV